MPLSSSQTCLVSGAEVGTLNKAFEEVLQVHKLILRTELKLINLLIKARSGVRRLFHYINCIAKSFSIDSIKLFINGNGESKTKLQLQLLKVFLLIHPEHVNTEISPLTIPDPLNRPQQDLDTEDSNIKLFSLLCKKSQRTNFVN